MSKKPLLTILLPTKNRSKDLDYTLRRITRSIAYAKARKEDVEVVIVNNFSSDSTEDVVKKWAEIFDYIKYYKHQESYNSAEESLCHGMKYCNGLYLWSFGDDDFMKVGAVKRMLSTIKTGKYEFIVQNSSFFSKNNIMNGKFNTCLKFKPLMNIEYKTYNLFREFGFWNITAGFSLVCFKREKFDIEIFLKLISISRIYSYSVALFICFCRSFSIFLSEPLIMMTENTPEGEFERISELSKNNGLLEYFAWSNGFIRLLLFAANKTKFPVGDMISFRELSFVRYSYVVIQNPVIENLFSFLKNEITCVKGYKKEVLYKKRSSSLLKDYILLLENLDDSFYFKNFYLKKLRSLYKVYKSNWLLFVLFYPFLRKKIKRIKKEIKAETFNYNQIMERNFAPPKKKSIISGGNGIMFGYNGVVKLANL